MRIAAESCMVRCRVGTMDNSRGGHGYSAQMIRVEPVDLGAKVYLDANQC